MAQSFPNRDNHMKILLINKTEFYNFSTFSNTLFQSCPYTDVEFKMVLPLHIFKETVQNYRYIELLKNVNNFNCTLFYINYPMIKFIRLFVKYRYMK